MTKRPDQTAIALRDKGLSFAAIAAQMGLSRYAARKLVKQADAQRAFNRWWMRRLNIRLADVYCTKNTVAEPANSASPPTT